MQNAVAAGRRFLATAPRAPRPPRAKPNSVEPVKGVAEEWTPVVHESSGQVYWWNQKTGETTALGEPKPGTPQPLRPAVGTATSLMGLVATGAGVGLVFGLLGKLF